MSLSDTSLQERHAEWVVVGANTTYGSFTDRFSADFYADAMRCYRGLESRVVHRDVLLRESTGRGTGEQ